MIYDKAIKDLEELVAKLNNDNVGIEESIELYGQGIILAKSALDMLKGFKGNIELLNKDLEKLEIELSDDDE